MFLFINTSKKLRSFYCRKVFLKFIPLIKQRLQCFIFILTFRNIIIWKQLFKDFHSLIICKILTIKDKQDCSRCSAIAKIIMLLGMAYLFVAWHAIAELGSNI